MVELLSKPLSTDNSAFFIIKKEVGLVFIMSKKGYFVLNAAKPLFCLAAYNNSSKATFLVYLP
jgi:hypothetical protein